jgi:Zn-dependent protease
MSLAGFYKRRITVARVFGIPVRIDYRWFVVFALSVWLIAANFERGGVWVGVRLLPFSPATAWLTGILTTLGLFVSVFGHELSHALMARSDGIEIEEIVLHPFGGLARLRNEPESPGAEFRVAIAGPGASFLFGVLAFVVWLIALSANYLTAASVFFLIGSGNLLLAIFNLFPGYPLDGGRVLRALLWKRSGNMDEATRQAGRCGMLVAATLIVFGIYMAVHSRAYFMGLWSVLVGIFLFDAAASIVRHVRGLTPRLVSEAMSPPFALEPDLLISNFVDDVLPLHRHASFPVAHNRRLQGVLSLEDLKSLPRERWRETRARDVMRPVGPQMFVAPEVTIIRAQELMKTNGVGSLGVVDHKGQLVGFLRNGPLASSKRD